MRFKSRLKVYQGLKRLKVEWSLISLEDLIKKKAKRRIKLVQDFTKLKALN